MNREATDDRVGDAFQSVRPQRREAVTDERKEEDEVFDVSEVEPGLINEDTDDEEEKEKRSTQKMADPKKPRWKKSRSTKILTCLTVAGADIVFEDGARTWRTRRRKTMK